MKTTDNLEVTAARLSGPFKLTVDFNTGASKVIDFKQSFEQLRGYYARYNTPEAFKNFIVEDGNLFWGENEDVVFPVADLYEGNLPGNENRSKRVIIYNSSGKIKGTFTIAQIQKHAKRFHQQPARKQRVM